MNSILLLTRLQVKQSVGGLLGSLEKKTGARGAWLSTILIGVLLFGCLAYAGSAFHGLVGKMGQATTVYNILFMACGTLTFTFSLPSVLGSFFGSSDINDLLPLPVSPFAIVFSKALGALTNAYLWTLVFIAGPLAGWGLAAGVSFRYWVVYVLAVIFTPLMPVSYAGTLSIIIATIFKRVRRKDAITTITTVLSLVVSMGAFFLINNSNSSSNLVEVLSNMSAVMGGVVMAFPAYGFAVYALVHADPLGTWMFVLLSLLSFAVFVLVARVLYMRIVTSLSAGGGRAEAFDAKTAQAQTPIFKALMATEARRIVRNSSVFLFYVAYPVVISPILYGVMFMTDSSAKMIDMMGKLDNATTVMAGIALAIIMLFATLNASSNKIATTAVSREGSNWIYMKFIPVPIKTQLAAKLMVSFIVSLLIALLFGAIAIYMLVIKMHVDLLVVLSADVLMVAAVWLMGCVGLWSESRSPFVDWGNDGDVNVKTLKGTGGELRAILVGLIYSALPILVSPVVKLDPYVFMPVLAIAGSVVSVALGWLCFNKAVKNIEAFE